MLLVPTFSTITLAGASILIVDLVPVIKALDNDMNNGSSYEDYVRLYNTHIALFISGIVLTAVGILGISVSIPLLVYKGNGNNVTLNFTPSPNDFIFDVRYNF